MVPGLRRLTEGDTRRGRRSALRSANAGLVWPTPAQPGDRVGLNSGSSQSDRWAVRPEATREDIDDAGTPAARLVAGFDAVEIHLGHNYLASAFASAAQIGVMTSSAVRCVGRSSSRLRWPAAPSGKQVAVTAKLNMIDGIRVAASRRRGLT